MTIYEITTVTGARYYCDAKEIGDPASYTRDCGSKTIRVNAGQTFNGAGDAAPQIREGEVTLAAFNTAHIVSIIAREVT